MAAKGPKEKKRQKSNNSKENTNGKKNLKFKNDKELLDFLKEKIIEEIDAGEIKLKVGDLLKVLEIQKKLSTDSSAEEKFWEVIEQIRQRELADD